MGKKDKNKKKHNGTDLEKSFNEMGDLGGDTYFKPKSGKNTLRILPPWSDSGVFFFKAIQHYNIQEKGGPVPCRTMLGKDCPICEALKKIGSKELNKKAGAKTRFYMNVIDRKHEDAGVKIWGVTARNMKKIKSAMEDPDYGDITDPEEGRDIIVELDDSGGGAPQYEIRPRVKTTEVGLDDWEENLHDLSEIVVQGFPSTKEYAKMVEEAFDIDVDDDDEGEDDDEEEKKSSKKKKRDKKDDKKKKKTKKQDDDDSDDGDDDDDSGDDDDEEDSRKDKKNKGSKKKKKQVEDDDDDDD